MNKEVISDLYLNLSLTFKLGPTPITSSIFQPEARLLLGQMAGRVGFIFREDLIGPFVIKNGLMSATLSLVPP